MRNEKYESHGTAIKLGSRGMFRKNWQESVSSVLRQPGSWHFRFNKSKRYGISKNVLVRGEPAFKSDIGEAISVCKKELTYRE